MSKPAARLGDMGSNHGPWHPSPITAGSGDVFTNNKPAARVGDSLAPHKKPRRPPHGRSIAAGASTVLINGKPAARVGDAISCGGSVAVGSGNVFIGDSPSPLSSKKVSLLDIVFPDQRGDIPPQPKSSPYYGLTMSEAQEVLINHKPVTEVPEQKDAVVGDESAELNELAHKRIKK